jgi:ABC-type multidrug transport system ATPase subunit
LGGCIVAGRLSGEVRLNGQPVQKQSYFRRISGYVMQDNLMLDTLTVTHYLLFLFHFFLLLFS